MDKEVILDHFKNANEIIEEAMNIGDVTTAEGKKRALTFILKAEKLYRENYYKIPITLPNGLSGNFDFCFSQNVMETIRYAVEQFKKACNPPNNKDYYFSGDTIAPGRDEADGLIGNLVTGDVVWTLHFGRRGASELLGSKQNPAYVKNYETIEEVYEMEESCKGLVNSLQDNAPTL